MFRVCQVSHPESVRLPSEYSEEFCQWQEDLLDLPQTPPFLGKEQLPALTHQADELWQEFHKRQNENAFVHFFMEIFRTLSRNFVTPLEIQARHVAFRLAHQLILEPQKDPNPTYRQVLRTLHIALLDVDHSATAAKAAHALLKELPKAQWDSQTQTIAKDVHMLLGRKWLQYAGTHYDGETSQWYANNPYIALLSVLHHAQQAHELNEPALNPEIHETLKRAFAKFKKSDTPANRKKFQRDFDYFRSELPNYQTKLGDYFHG